MYTMYILLVFSFSSFRIVIFQEYKYTYFSFCVVTEKERIDSGYFLYQAGLKKKKEKKDKEKTKEYSKSVDTGLGAMFEMDSNTDESNHSSSCSDEDFSITQKRKRG